MRVVLASRPPRCLDRWTIWLDAGGHRILSHRRVEKLPPKPWIVAAGLLCASPAVVARGDFIEALWGDDREGGPLGVEKLVDVYVMQARRALLSFAVLVELSGYGVGWSARRMEIPLEVSA